MKQENDYSYNVKILFDEVKDLEKGVLFRCIEIMAPENADEIINYFSIQSSNSFYDDFQILNQTPSFQPILKRVDLMNIRNAPLIGFIKKPIDWTPNFSVGVIVIIALVAVSLWNLQQRQKRLLGGNQGINDIVTPQNERSEGNLWLVIPCSRIEPSLKKAICEKDLLPDEAVALVKESVYFLAPADNYTPRLTPNSDWESLPEDGDLFVQLHIPDGGDLVGVDLKRSLSRSLSTKERSIIKKIGLLHDLNSLEKFHRA